MSFLDSSLHSTSRNSNSKNTCNQFFYVLPTDNEEFFKEKIDELQAKGKLPDLEETSVYKIFRWKPHYFTHESIVVGSDKKYFTIELRVNGGTPILYAEAVDVDVKKYTYCGKTRSTGYELLAKAISAFKSMKIYNGFFNNCQDFVNKFLKEVGLADQTKWTDSSNGAIAIAVGMGIKYIINPLISRG